MQYCGLAVPIVGEGEAAVKHWIRQVMCCVGGAALVGLAIASVAGAQALRATAPPGYHVVQVQHTAPPGLFDAGGQAACPTGTVVWGGGTQNDYANSTINTSEFLGTTGWNVRVNNNAGNAQGFEVDAICAKKPSLYKFVSHQFDDPAGVQKTGSATCPTGTVLLSGSVLSEGDTTNVFLTSAWPNGQHKFSAVQWNGSASDEPFFVYALCAKKPPGYAITRVTQTAAALTGLVEPETYCPSGSSVIGGGIQVVNPNPAAIMSASLVGAGSTTAWLGLVKNTGTASVKVTASVICAA
jgi:hypothetical protein